MSGQSPASVLYSSDGTELSVVSGSAVPSGTRALLISGVNPSGNALYVPTAAEGALGVTQMSNDFIVRNNATLTTSGSTLVTANYFGTQEIALIVNATVTPTGTTPVITFTIQEVDPGNGTTVFGNSASTSAINSGNAPGVFTAVLNSSTSPMVQVSWTVTGTTPSFTGVYVTVVTKSTPLNQNVVGTGTAGAPAGGVLTIQGVTGGTPIPISGNITATAASDGYTGQPVPAQASLAGALVTTAAESGLTSGDLYALNMTTTGQLRIDGVYPLATAVATAVDMGQVGGVVTTAAPSYTNATVNALSLDGYGNLRTLSEITDGTNGPVAVKAPSTAAVATDRALVVAISPNNTVTTTNSSVSATGAAPPANATYIGALANTSAPTDVNGDMYPLSLTTSGLLRIDGVYPINATTPTSDVTFVGGAVTTAAPTYTNGQLSALSLDGYGNLRVLSTQGTAAALSGAWPVELTDGTNVLGTTAHPVNVTGVIVTNRATTSAVTTVAGSTSNTAILAANTNRIFASIYNNTNKNMYILLNSGTASTTNFSIILLTGSYWEVPNDWAGAINAVWASGVTGNALVTEMTP